MKQTVFLLAAGLVGLAATPSQASDRYREMPPVVVSPDLSAPWVIQLGHQAGPIVQPQRRSAFTWFQSKPRAQQPQRRAVGYAQPGAVQVQQVNPVQTAAYVPSRQQVVPQMDPMFLPQQVGFASKEKPGSIVIDTEKKFLYLVETGSTARRYGVGVGKEAFLWTGTEKITRKAEWPNWHPPAEMIAREREKGRILPASMEGGPANPLGARAMYLGSTLYRIHGTNAPWTIGTNVSSGCIRLRNEDISDLFERVKVGAKVVVM